MTFASLIEDNNDTIILKPLLNDAKHSLLKNREILNIAPLQLYSSAIVFAPETSIIRNRFKDHIPSWLYRVPIIEEAWNAEPQIFNKGHMARVNSLAFSTDGKLIASGSDDKTIRLWNTVTGDLQLTLEGHSGPIFSVAFASHDKLLTSGSGDNTIKIWHTITGDLRQTYHDRDSIHSVAFSPNSDLIISGCRDGSINNWDIATSDE